MKNKLLIIFILIFVDANIFSQPKLVDYKKNQVAYLCLFVSIKDTIDFGNNNVFYGLIKDDKYFEQYVNEKEYNPLYYSLSMSNQIEKKIFENGLVEIPAFQFDTYLNSIKKGLTKPNNLRELDVYIADSLIYEKFSLDNLIKTDMFSRTGCFIKVLKINT